MSIKHKAADYISAWDVLGITANATADDIQAAYLKHIKANHQSAQSEADKQSRLYALNIARDTANYAIEKSWHPDVRDEVNKATGKATPTIILNVQSFVNAWNNLEVTPNSSLTEIAGAARKRIAAIRARITSENSTSSEQTINTMNLSFTAAKYAANNPTNSVVQQAKTDFMAQAARNPAPQKKVTLADLNAKAFLDAWNTLEITPALSFNDILKVRLSKRQQITDENTKTPSTTLQRALRAIETAADIAILAVDNPTHQEVQSAKLAFAEKEALQEKQSEEVNSRSETITSPRPVSATASFKTGLVLGGLQASFLWAAFQIATPIVTGMLSKPHGFEQLPVYVTPASVSVAFLLTKLLKNNDSQNVTVRHATFVVGFAALTTCFSLPHLVHERGFQIAARAAFSCNNPIRPPNEKSSVCSMLDKLNVRKSL